MKTLATLATTRPPSWLPNGCPSWCHYRDEHTETTHPDDRAHLGRASHLQLSAEPPLEDGPATIDAHLIQHVAEPSPRVWLGRDETTNGVTLTVIEARQLAARLVALAEAAEGVRS